MATAAMSALLGGVVNHGVGEIFKIERRDLKRGLPLDLENLRIRLRVFHGILEDKFATIGDPSAVRSISMEEMRDLAQDIEDSLDKIARSQVSSVHDAKEVKKLTEKLKAAQQLITEHPLWASMSSSGSRSAAKVQSYTPPSVVGIHELKNQIVEELLKNDSVSTPKVIAIVGFSGAGKTVLAKEIYNNNHVVRLFQCRAWVLASKHGDDSKALLTELFRKFYPQEKPGEDLAHLKAKISNHLRKKRYLIVLDDIIEENLWHWIESIFSNSKRSAIVVTTSIQSVAKVCTHINGYIHNMEALDDKQSKELLISILPERSYSLERSSTSVLYKCDGHPLSLASVGHYLSREDVITEGGCENLCRRLGQHVATEASFLEMREMLLKDYTRLPRELPCIKTCLMYMSLFPKGYHIKGSTLKRRWLAEKFLEEKHPVISMEVANTYVRKLVDQNVIIPDGASKNSRVRGCKLHGIMHEFMLYLSRCTNFITSLDDPMKSRYRHLFREDRVSTSRGRSSSQDRALANPTQGSKFVNKAKKHFQIINTLLKKKEEKKLSAHSITICGNAGEGVREFCKCEFLRVLDLEACDDLKDEDIDGIHELWHLRYLSLGATIRRLPRDIEKLNCLETLDVRKTKTVIILPMIIFKLPHLTHLLGKFKLEDNDLKKSRAGEYVPKECKLQTVAGFVADREPVFPMLLFHMKELRKIKAWCNSYCNELLDAIAKFLGIGMHAYEGERSLSLHLGKNSRFVLSSLESYLENAYGYLSALKIHGALGSLDRLTLSITSLIGLEELCLSSAGDVTVTESELSRLGQLKRLQYLKLVKVSLGGLAIREQHFLNLSCLCLVQSGTLPAIENGALKNLVSLQLLAEDLGDLSGIKIEQHKHLREIALDSKVNEVSKTVLQDAVQKHPKKPSVLFLNRLDPEELGSIVKYAAAKKAS